MEKVEKYISLMTNAETNLKSNDLKNEKNKSSQSI